MPQAQRSSDIGLRKGRLLCNMSHSDRLSFIADGLPIIFESANSLIRASRALIDYPREAEILEGHAEEECAKLLILIDLARCPIKRVAARTGPMMHWFYDHLARLIYANAQRWHATNACELQEYIDQERKSHYLEGEYGEFIMPNWSLFQRETALYADVAADEGGTVQWVSPERSIPGLVPLAPIAFQIADALSAFGVLTAPGVKIVHDVWGTTQMTADTPWDITRDRYLPLVERLDAAGLITERATHEHANLLCNKWQMPMYEMEFSQIDVPLENLISERDAQIPGW